MPKQILALHRGKNVTPEQAKLLKEHFPDTFFFCIECRELVDPHVESGPNAKMFVAAHFEHAVHNPECSLCHKGGAYADSSGDNK